MRKLAFKLRDFDWIIFFNMLFLIAIGLVIIYITGFKEGGVGGLNNAVGQMVFAGTALFLYFLFSFSDYRMFKNFAIAFYIINLLLLVAVFIVGEVAGGASRWLDIGFFRFQPSEPMKLALIIMLAWFFSNKVLSKDQSLKNLIISGLIAGVPIIIVMLQPDLGTSLTFLAIWFGMILMSQISKTYIVAGIAGFILATPLIYSLLHDYQQKRILTFIDPYADPLGAGYNVIQSTIAVGSGGITGNKYTLTQSLSNFLPAQHTDFIFATMSEKMGFIGTLLVLGLFLLLLFRILRGTFLAQDNFGRFVAVGIFSLFLFQVLVNAGMNMGVMPVTGIPLPFISYGGSALITMTIILGVFQSIVVHHKKIKF